jgi:hypothetical protein
MSAPFVVLILLMYGIVAVTCHDAFWASLKRGEGWAVAALVTVAVALFTVGAVL